MVKIIAIICGLTLYDTLTFISRIRVDYSITRRAHSPTPGVYLGQKKDKAPKLSPSKREKEISPDRTPVKYPYKGRSRTKSMSPESIAKRYVPVNLNDESTISHI